MVSGSVVVSVTVSMIVSTFLFLFIILRITAIAISTIIKTETGKKISCSYIS